MQKLITLTRQRLVCPAYHTISDSKLPHLSHLYPVRSAKTFEKDMDFLLKHYQPLSYADLLSHSKEPQPRRNGFFLSFDDGFREVYDIVLPVLLRKGVPAMVFVNPDFIDNRDMLFRCKASLLVDKLESGAAKNQKQAAEVFYQALHKPFSTQALLKVSYQNRDLLDRLAEILEVDFTEYLQTQRPYLSTAELKELASKGIDIGAHSLDHPLYSGLSFEEQCRQTTQSWLRVKELVPTAAKAFAFPFTDFGVGAAFFDWLHSDKPPAAPNAQPMEATFGVAGLKREAAYPHHFHRIPMEKSTASAEAIFIKEYLYYILKMPLGKNTLRRR